MKIDPRHLEMLAAIVDGGGLTEGAAVLGKSQPSVSRSLSLLEQRIGARLFVPGRRPLQPTDLCRALAGEGRAILGAGAQAAALVAQYRDGRVGAVRVGGTPIFMEGVISTMIAGFQADMPDIRIDQTSGYHESLLAGLAADTLDLALLPLRRDNVPPGHRAHRVLRGRNVIACRVGHPLTRGGTIRLSQVATYPWIAPPADSPLYRDLREVLEGIGVRDFKVSFTGGALSAVLTILHGSDALTVLPYSVVFLLRRQNALAALPIRIGDPDRHLCLLVRDDAKTRPEVARFQRFVEGRFRTLASTIERQEQNSLWRGGRRA